MNRTGKCERIIIIRVCVFVVRVCACECKIQKLQPRTHFHSIFSNFLCFSPEFRSKGRRSESYRWAKQKEIVGISWARLCVCACERDKMSESRPITTPPRRRNNLLAHVQHVFNSGNSAVAGGNSSSAIEASTSSSSHNGGASTNGTIRKLESYHHALLESGCQSAKSSPLPHRRLDKLEGVIRDKPITPAISSMRRILDCADDNSGMSSCEPSPAFVRKRLNSNGTAAASLASNVMDHRFINNHQESPMPYRRPMQHQHNHHSTTVADYKNAINKSSLRLDSGECKSMTQRQSAAVSSPSPPPLPMRACYDSECCSANLRPIFVGHHDNFNHLANLSSPAKNSRLGEPGVFASPARSVCSNRVNHCIEDSTDDDTVVQPHADRSIVSGWLKFRDNKRVSDVTLISIWCFLET